MVRLRKEVTMMEEKYFKLEDIKEIRLNWDIENVVFPRNVIKEFSYTYNKEKNNYFQNGLYLSEIYLEVDLDYVQNEFSYYWYDFSKDKKNIDCLKYNNVWYIAITTNDDEEYGLVVPFYSKNFFLDENTNIYNDRNLFELHEQKENSYVIKWAEDKQITKLTLDEMILLFQNKKKNGARNTNNNFQIEVLSRLLKEKDENERLAFFGLFCYLFIDGRICGIKKGYKIDTVSKEEKDFSAVSLNIYNNENRGSIDYVFVKTLENCQNILNYLNSIHENINFNKTIIVLDHNIINLDHFYQELSESLKKEEILNNIICVSLDKMNQIWFDLVQWVGELI